MITVFFDGCCMGNPGTLGSWAYVMYEGDTQSNSSRGILEGDLTNNVAEFTAILEAVRYLRAQAITHAVVKGDSKLVIEQLSGSYKVKSATSLKFVPKIKALLQDMQVAFAWVPRSENRKADSLCREVIRKYGRRDA